MKASYVILGFFIATLATVLSYLFIDAPAAVFFHRLIESHPLIREYASNIPDLLLPIVLIVTSVCWIAYFVSLPQGIHNVHTRFLQWCGVSLPLAYAAKSILQYTFGRVDPKIWLFHHQLAGFHWFHEGSRYGSFPSGHMTVFTALAVMLWHSYPRIRVAYLAALIVLGLLLVATNYHFVSDVAAGAYLGLLVCYLTDAGLGAVSGSYRAS